MMGSMVLSSGSVAELLYWAPICWFEIAPHRPEALAILQATIVSSTLPKHDCSEMGRYDLAVW